MKNEDTATPTRERIREVSAVFSGLPGIGIGGEDDILALLRLELGHEEALDRPVRIGGMWQRALAPRMTYHVCAANLPVSAMASLALGLVLGGRLVFKLPSRGLESLHRFIDELPPALRVRVECRAEHDPVLMQGAEAVVVFGGEETMAEFRREVRWDQRFLAYGPKISLGWILPGTASPEWARAAAVEVGAFQQRGCLSPQSYLCADAGEAEAFGRMLAAVLADAGGGSFADIPWPVQAQIREARKRAQVRGDLVLSSEFFPGWTVVVRREARIEVVPGYGYIEVLPAHDPAVWADWKGRISSVSVNGVVDLADFFDQFAGSGVGRICLTGSLQDPPLLWRHDGQPRLAPLVRWIACDPGLEEGRVDVG